MDTKPVIEFNRIVRGTYQMIVDGIARPVYILRDGKAWIVQHADAERRNAKIEVVHYGFRTLHFAKTIAERVWDVMRTARALAEAEAHAETEMIALHAEALEINSRVAYIDGHGAFPYVLLPVEPLIVDGVPYFPVKAASGRGMEWSYRAAVISPKPFV